MSVALHAGDCWLSLNAFVSDESVDAAVMDPPYALTSIVDRWGADGVKPPAQGGVYARSSRGFMGKAWDTGQTAFEPSFWREVWRVLKPGAYLLAFGGSRTYHRLACAIEDAGFVIRDQIQWVYGSGFPKNHATALAVERTLCERRDRQWFYEGTDIPMRTEPPYVHYLADAWEGWGTALKPAHEPIVMAQKPLRGRTMVDNIELYGVGPINIDACRVPIDLTRDVGQLRTMARGERRPDGYGLGSTENAVVLSLEGRWPANIIHDGSPEVISAFPAAPGQQADLQAQSTARTSRGIYGDMGAAAERLARGDAGSAARFFYCAKASARDREEGCEGLPKQRAGMVSETSGQHITRRDAGYELPLRSNTHPTVKPTELMRYLVRLVTPPGGIVLDAFMGSGSTGKAAVLEGKRFIGCEADDEYMAIARERIAWAQRIGAE